MKKQQLVLIGAIIILVIALIILFLSRQPIVNNEDIVVKEDVINIIGEGDRLEDIEKDLVILDENIDAIDEMIINLEQQIEEL